MDRFCRVTGKDECSSGCACTNTKTIERLIGKNRMLRVRSRCWEVCHLIEFCVDERILTQLQEDLKKHGRILLLSSSLKTVDLFQEKLAAYLKNGNQCDPHLLLLAWEGFPLPESGIAVRMISKQEENMLTALYRMYDFSDRFSVWSDDGQYGTILNYVRSGLITWDEVFCTMLAGSQTK